MVEQFCLASWRCFGCDISPRDCDAVDDKTVLNLLLIVEFHLQEIQKSQAVASVMPWHNQDQKEAGCRSGSESRVVSQHSAVHFGRPGCPASQKDTTLDDAFWKTRMSRISEGYHLR